MEKVYRYLVGELFSLKKLINMKNFFSLSPLLNENYSVRGTVEATLKLHARANFKISKNIFERNLKNGEKRESNQSS